MDPTGVHVWLVDVDDERSVRRSTALLPPAETARLSAVITRDRHRRLGAQAALRILAAEAAGVRPAELLVRREPNGKPFLAHVRGPHISLSHSGRYAGVAVTRTGPVGVDIEEQRPVGHLDGLARTMMSDAEYAWWLTHDEATASESLFRHWTYKEAVLKALGLGLGGGLSSVVCAEDGGGPVLRALPAGAGRATGWTLHDLFRPEQRAAPLPCAVAVGAPDVPLQFHRTSLAELLEPGNGRAHPARDTCRSPASRSLAPPVARSPGHDRSRSFRSRKERVAMSHPMSASYDEASPGAAPVTLFVVPHAGGSGAYYRPWSRWLPAGVRLETLDLPGHSIRIREPLIAEWGPLADDLTAQLRARLSAGSDQIYVLAGHSLGALLAYEMARRMTAVGAPPALLLVSGRNGPAVGLSHRPIHGLADARFLDAVERLGGTPDGALRDPEMLRMYLPLLRADLRLAETYTRPPGPPLDVPIAAFAGRWDQMTDDQGLIAWNRETTASLDLRVLDGSHFFHDSPAFATEARARLERLLPVDQSVASPAPRTVALAETRENAPTGTALQEALDHLQNSSHV
ncbi:thioesterase domain-containing protein [Streptomyces sp. NPDC127119]|uniref:thioesterase domain-containing protein n=1 Tax=Streptomyces sp. NPDC127119 TaxID=3345370 RepID=UPI0036416E78